VRAALLSLGLVAVVALVKLPEPFMGDQALATLMAAKLTAGEALYRDLWDLKQPGIFVFYAIAGTIFGFSEVGIHAFELLYQLSFAATLLWLLPSYLTHGGVRALTPLLTVGLYYGMARAQHQTQTEALVGFPMFLTLWLALAGPDRPRWRCVVSGMLGGVVLVFKLALLPIVAMFWAVGGFDWARRGGRSLLTFVALVTAGATVAPLLVVLHLSAHGTLGDAAWTFFRYPREAIAITPIRGYQLVGGASWFVARFAPLVALALIGASSVSLRPGPDRLTLSLLLWVVLGAGVILGQVISWWEYHYLLLVVPLGLLAAKGLDLLWPYCAAAPTRRARAVRRAAALAALVVLFLPAAAGVLVRARLLLADGLALSAAGRQRYQNALSEEYALVRGEIVRLPRGTPPQRDLYVFATPLYYFLAERDPPISLLASWFTSTPELWDRLFRELDAARPAHVLVDPRAMDAVRSRSPSVATYIDGIGAFLARSYTVERTTPAGIWYVRR